MPGGLPLSKNTGSGTLSNSSRTTASVWKWLSSEQAARCVHYVSLLVGFVVLLYLARHQWFTEDDFDFIRGFIHAQGSEQVMTAHNGHWSTVPFVIWYAIFRVVGLKT